MDLSTRSPLSYEDACHRADSIRIARGLECSVNPGSNGGYFIEAFGKSYRFASVESACHVAELFLAIVSNGPVSDTKAVRSPRRMRRDGRA